MLDLPVWFVVGSFVVLSVILAADLALVSRRSRVPSVTESSLWVGFYVALALLFALLLLFQGGGESAGQFVAGWLTEYSLSIDNLFVFVIIMGRFVVPAKLQQTVLLVGIIVALIFRGVFILLGAQLIESFSWIFYLFGAFLVFTAYTQAFGKKEDEATENLLISLLRRRAKISDSFEGTKLRTTVNGTRYFTPMLIVFLAIGSTDLLFALDSIPAIFGVTESPFIVFTANIFALMGLRQLYFLLGGLIDKLKYITYGIAFILAFIGMKLVLHALHENDLPFLNAGQPVPVWDIETSTSLLVIVASMTVATLASLVALRCEHHHSESSDGRSEVVADAPTAIEK
ncbi:TerC/Alx family metal homeostasis membrane protein [Rathayibacter toxicus]|uniref:Tellurium resistance protein TerC n=1 Tax=Rathayibacter toxicus TaxID=145458 RepID=A0A2S5Y5Y7_9MICO|nr:TerC/Alx family metal homeostasis membrane protein [Rathayibacter toxicus]PPH22558.1 tellurium resistance protein TerC [Rathayibacter toxicus]PPH56758.1 tellurium resistance protein TerC [Rathayibacter toxicus]PPH59452.1 tellurium resistance protein TerC [Rathayibacter toxicus]PPH86682.1 tellurium resistance protein TerC [Rathayibacter toxicus]PPI14399.1 tellurium resistance protein TerC [Rathayibacter toxicus]